MSNGEFCCAVGLCCPPASVTRRAALISEMSKGLADTMAAKGDESAGVVLEHVADWLMANVDMAPKGTLDLERVVEMVRKHHGV